MKRLILLIAVTFSLLQTSTSQTNWKAEIENLLPMMGHRNWILVVDAAYPLQINPGIQTLTTGENQLDVVREVLKRIEDAPHVSPDIFLDKEIDFVSEKEVSDIKKYRKQLDKLLDDQMVTKLLHEQLLQIIDEAGQTYQVLVLKTNQMMPYTSVFIRLDCGYWNAEQEQQMRETMK